MSSLALISPKMGILDTLEEVGSAAVDSVSSLPSAAAGAVGFASEIAGRTAALVGDLTGVSGIPDAVRGVVGRVRETVDGAIDTVVDAAANPRRTIQRAADAAFSGASRALTNTQGFVNRILDGATNLAGSVASGVSGFATNIARNIADRVTHTVSGIGNIVLNGTSIAQDLVTRALGTAVNFGGRLIDGAGGLVQRGIGLATTALQNVAHNVADRVATGVRNIAGNLTRMATNLTNNVSRVAMGTANIVGRVADMYGRGISRIAGGINSVVQTAAGTIAPHLPGPLGNLVMRGAGFVGNVATGVGSLATGAAARVKGLAHGAATFVATRSGEAQAFVTAELAAIREELAGKIVNAGDLVAGGFEHIGQRLTEHVQQRMLRLHQRLEGISTRIHERVTQVAEMIQGAVPVVVNTINHATHAIEGHLEERLQQGVGFVRDRFTEVVEGGRRVVSGVAGVGQRALGFGQRIVDRAIDVGASVVGRSVDFGAAVAGGIADTVRGGLDGATRFQMQSRPNDGELTGPFLPGEPMVEPEQVGSLHSRSNAGAREGMVSGGASLFINGIDTSLADHYRAAQRLANEVGSPVVGVYNASAGAGTDLIQCAADKMFDRSGNPAIRTLTRLITTYGDARQPRGGLNIFAHSQGSLILSEALRQAAGSGADISGNDVTTFGNAAFTFPSGPQYHHYVHDDDAVASSVGTGSAISEFMNQPGLGSLLARFALGPISDAQADTTTLHHGGAMIAPHAINAPDRHDYIGDLSSFRAAEATRRTGGASARRAPSTAGASVFAVARGAGTMAAEAVSSGYGSVDSGIRSLPSMPGMRPNAIWNMIDSGMRGVGRGIVGLGDGLGAMMDARYSRLAVQRDGIGGPSDRDIDGHAVKAKLDAAGSTGFSPDSSVREQVGGIVGFDPAHARFHTGPAAADAARDMSARAFTIGRDVYFGAGTYQPGSAQGMSLIAHELTHVAQQSDSQQTTRFFNQQGGDQMEQEAQRSAQMVLANAGSRQGLHVDRFIKDYESEEGLTAEDVTRLERISVMALQEAERLVGNRSLRAFQVDVEVHIDLRRMSDAQASTVWAQAIVAGLRESTAVSPAAMSRKSVQRTPETPFYFADAPNRASLELPEDTRTVDLDIEVHGERVGHVTYGQGLQALRHRYGLLCDRVTSGWEGHTYLANIRDDQWIVGAISDTLGGVSMPPLDMWAEPAAHLRTALAFLNAHNLEETARELLAAERLYNRCQQRLNNYRDGTISGAGSAVTGLEHVKVYSAIGVGVLSAGTLSAPAAMVVGIGYTAAQTTAQQGMEVHLGLRDHIDWAGIAFDAAISYVIARFMGPLGNRVAGNLLRNPAFQGMARALIVRTVQDILTGRLSSMLSLTAHQIFDHARGNREAMTWEQYTHAIADQLSNPELYFQDILSGMGGRAAGRHYEAGHGGSPAPAPAGVSPRMQAVLDIPPAATPNAPAASRQLPALADPAAPSTAHTETPQATTPATAAPVDGASPAAPAAPATSGDVPTAPTTAHPTEPTQTTAHPTEPAAPRATAPADAAPTPTHPVDPAAPTPGHPAETVAAPTEAATPSPRRTTPPLERVTGQRRGESAAQRRARVAREVAQREGTPQADTAEPTTRAADEHAATPTEAGPQVTQRHLDAVNAGGTGGAAAAEQLIREVGSFRQLREMATGNPPRLTPEGVRAVNEARARIQERIRGEIAAQNPNIEFLAPGTTGFGSDTDVTVRPRDYRSRTTPEAIAEGVRQAGEAVQEANRRAREAGGGREPDETLDTNYYSWTGADAPMPTPASAQQQVGGARTVASMAEQHQSMTPEGWAEYRRTMLREAGEGRRPGPEVGEAQQRFEAEAVEHLRRQLDAAEAMSNRLRTEREAIEAQLRASDSSITTGGAQMRAREQLAAQYRARLLEALRQTPVNHAEVASLQAQITMIEPGAYASRAGVADVVGFQQTAVGRGEATFTPGGERVATEDYAHVQMRLRSGEILDTTAGTLRVMELNPVTGMRDLADSAGSSLAQFEAHAQHAPSGMAGALDLIKNTIKYSSRLMHADAATRAGTGDAPAELSRGYSRDEGPVAALEGMAGGEVSTIGGQSRSRVLEMLGNSETRAQALDLIVAESGSRGFGNSMEQLATAYATARLAYARRTAASIRVRATTQEAVQTGLSPTIVAPSLDRGAEGPTR